MIVIDSFLDLSAPCELKAACSNCNKEFPTKKYLMKHIRIHDMESGNYSYDQCPFKGKDDWHLERHKNKHLKENKKSMTRNFQCDWCPFKARDLWNLGRHKKSVHKDIVPNSNNIVEIISDTPDTGHGD